MFVYTFNVMYSYYMLSHSTDWHLLDVVHNILNMQRQGRSQDFSKGGAEVMEVKAL